MTKVAKQGATYEDLLKVPDGVVAEIVEGELYTSPRPGSRHAQAALDLASQVHRAFHKGDGGPGGWWIVFEPELHLGGDVLVPDIAGWRRERIPEVPDVVAWTIEPDWVCEVISRSTGRLDRMLKMPAYARYGIPYAWIVDPYLHTIEVFQLVDGRWKTLNVYDGDQQVRIEPFDAIEIPLATLWLPEKPPA